MILAAGALSILAQEQKPEPAGASSAQDGGGEATSLLQVLDRDMKHPVLQSRAARYVLRPSGMIEIDFPFAPTLTLFCDLSGVWNSQRSRCAELG